MKKEKRLIKYSILFIITIILITSTANIYFCESKSNPDLFNEVLNKTNGQVVKCGLITSFTTKEDKKEICKYILKNIEPEARVKEILYGKTYCLEFNKGSVEGYVQSREYNGQNVITINISSEIAKNNILQLKEKVQNSIVKVNKDNKNKFFCYLRAKINSNDLAMVNKEIIECLKEHNVKNIETIKLNNGYSTVCYTGRYDAMQVYGKLVDFNYSISRYSSGNYLIIGTPQIILDY